MPKVKKYTRTQHIIEIDDIECELEYEPDSCVNPVIRQLDDGRVVVGYLVYDDDAENPLTSCDAMGKIYDRRHLNKDEQYDVNEALGLDSYGEPDEELKPNPYAVLLDVYSHSGDCWRVHGDGKYFLDERWDVSNCAGVWLPDKYAIEEIESQTKSKKKRRELAIKFAGQAVDCYNMWLGGENYGICIESFAPDGTPLEQHACWGYLGSDNTEKEMKSEVASFN